MFYVYILYSKTIDTYYVGSSSMSLEDRLRRHLSSHSGFTARAKDWEVAYFETYEGKKEAILREQEIKKWKSRVRIIELVSG